MADLKEKNMEELYGGGNISVSIAAKVMHKGPMFVRVGLQRGILPFGVAIKKDEHGKQYDYYISPHLFRAYTGWDGTINKSEDESLIGD